MNTIIKISSKNIENYFDVEIEFEEKAKDYFILIFEYDKYFIYANTEVNKNYTI